jgi:hypothetical protein
MERQFNTVYFKEVPPHVDPTQTAEEIYYQGLGQRMKWRGA